jgi:UDP-glucuronate 4-epimerase
VPRYLVTGCAGFIASHVAHRLLDRGDEVVGLDNLNDAYDPRLKEWRLAQLTARPAFRFHRLDIADPGALAEFFSAEERTAAVGAGPPFAAIVNLAARAGVRASVEDPATYYRTNCDGTLHLLEMCRRFGVKKFVLASTSSLYGAHNPTPYREDCDTNRPLSPYAASKKAAETLAFTYHHLHGLDVAVLRYFTVYGPAGRPDMSVFRFVRRMAEGEPIVVYGDGTQQRDFTYVDDIARGTIAALAPAGYEVINLGGDRPVELSYVIATISELVGRKPVIERRPPHPADVQITWADVTRAQQRLGWRSEVSLEAGLEACVAWYRAHRELARTIRLGE